ncbi:hypothetical protein EV363DRAFT_1411008 [Boletus edulis]|nr:hypothetical protein EV363DRAFT_1411008 [Boletus edulis]
MAKVRTAEVIKWAHGQRIYRMTEMIERAQAWPRQGGPTCSNNRKDREGPGPENLFDYRKNREGPGMVKARTAEVIEWANGQRIYRMTEMIERAQAWPSYQIGPLLSLDTRPKIKWGPYFRELLYGSINHDEALTRPRLIYTEDLEGAFARSPRLTDSKGRALTSFMEQRSRDSGGDPIGEGLLDGSIHMVRPWQVQTGIFQKDFQMIQGTTKVIAEAMYTWNLNVKDNQMIMTQRGTAVNIC